MMASTVDLGTLSWVKDEIDLALAQAGEALAQHAAAPGEARPLAVAREHLHQAGGALDLAGLAGVAYYVAGVEARLAALAAEGSTHSVVVNAAAGALLTALRRYLDALMDGHPDQPLRLLPLYGALMAAAGQPAPDPRALFFPDLGIMPPQQAPAQRSAEPLPAARLKALRLGCARGLAKWRSGDLRGRVELRNALAYFERSRATPAERAPWWIALAWLDAEPRADDRRLDELDARLAPLVQEPPGHVDLPPELRSSLLYDIALAPPGSEHLESVRAAYRLAELVPAADADDTGSIVNDTRRAACRAPLATAMAEWESFGQGSAIALMRFHDVALLLAASARESGDAALAKLAGAVADFAAWLRQQPERTNATLVLDVAGALVLIADACETEGMRNPGDEALFVADVATHKARLSARLTDTADAPLLPAATQRWQSRRLVQCVAREIRNNLDAVAGALDSCFRTPGSRASDASLVQLHQVAGALRLVGETCAADAADALAAHLGNAAPATETQAAETQAAESQAAQLARLVAFTDSLAHGQPDRALFDVGEILTPANPTTSPVTVSPNTPSTPPPPPSSTDRDAELLAIFIEEARDVLAALAISTPRLAAQPDDRDALRAVRRSFHTLKGSGRMVNLVQLGDAAYAVEHLLNDRLDAHQPADGPVLAAIEQARQLFAAWVDALVDAGEPPDAKALLAGCTRLATDAGEADAVASAVPPAPTFAADFDAEAARREIALLRDALSGPAAVPDPDAITAARWLAELSDSAGADTRPVAALAQALAGVLATHAQTQTEPHEDTRMLLARTVGALEGMVGALAEHRAPADEVALTAALMRLASGKTADEVADAAAESSAPATPGDTSPISSAPIGAIAPIVPDPRLLAIFLDEADEQLPQLAAALRTWHATPSASDPGRQLARLLHTFKGGARLAGALALGDDAHAMETRVEQAMATDAADPARLTTLAELDAALDRIVSQLGALHPATVTAAVATATALPANPAPDPTTALRIPVELIDQLVGEATELATSRNRMEGSLKHMRLALADLTDNVARLRGQLREFEILAETHMPAQVTTVGTRRDFDPLEFDRFTRLQELTRLMAESVEDVSTVQHTLLRQADVAGEALAAQSRQNRALSHALLRARTVPCASVEERLRRVVAQTARELGREVDFVLQGSDTPIDRRLLDRMLAPLEHLLRNAVAHGIEPPETRRAAGKPPTGRIMLDVVAGENEIALHLTDDGGGLDREAIRARAVAQGLLTSDAVEVDTATLDALIFHPGFSTAATVSALAGRGIGLDVVRGAVADSGGRLRVTSEPNQGTRFEIVLPLTLAVMAVMVAEIDGHRWAIPAALVAEARELDAAETAALRAEGAALRDGQRHALHRLHALYGMARATAEPASGWLLLLDGGDRRIALVADALTASQEVAVKPPARQIARVPGLTGACVLADGAVALVVNPLTLLRRGAVLPEPSFSPVNADQNIPLILVVDDSLTVRKITGRLLERAGYRVRTAKDGVDALEQLGQLEQPLPALILADIEMPRMDGFELLRTLRADPRFAALPVIMITSRSADKHRQVAATLGVKHFLGKPYDEAALLSLIAAEVRS
jgi:chemosensory pili system protein ChpA (sensor histidine kinase/response regulator)